ncbi:MAG: hypothetical protein AAF711_00675 [Planctomycetota bacterium]
MRYTVQLPIDPSWGDDHVLRLYKGKEGASNLAASTPSGGSPVKDIRLGRAAASSQFKISFDHRAANVCGQLPVGVSCIDAAGNESAVVELLVPLLQAPEPPGRPDVAATDNNDPGQAVLTWLPSPDVPSS